MRAIWITTVALSLAFAAQARYCIYKICWTR